MTATYSLGWCASSSAQIELFTGQNAKSAYQVKYASPLRPTMRSPLQPSNLGPGEIGDLNTDLDRLAAGHSASRSRGPGAAPIPLPPKPSPEEVVTIGKQLYRLVVPAAFDLELRASTMFLEIGVDERLIGYPWELMHDGKEFICLKHNLGRFVNSATAPSGLAMRAQPRQAAPGPLSMLLISVPNPQPRGNDQYEPLDQAVAETNAIAATLGGMDGVVVKTLYDDKATSKAVFTALQQHYDIVHYVGHARFDEKQPEKNALVLWDKDMPTGSILSFFSMAAPTFCFINACESARVTSWKAGYDVFGVGRAFLSTGAYMLGSRWKVTDTAAAEFASAFYTAALLNGKSIGEAVRDARRACMNKAPDDLGWASYVLFADPRVGFSRTAN